MLDFIGLVLYSELFFKKASVGSHQISSDLGVVLSQDPLWEGSPAHPEWI